MAGIFCCLYEVRFFRFFLVLLSSQSLPLSWFAFAPLIPEAIRTDLGLTPKQIANSNIVALCATLIVRLITGPAVDRFGPRLVMASLLVIGAIPSGLAGTVSTAGGLYTVRFFIGILGGTFVPCQGQSLLLSLSTMTILISVKHGLPPSLIK